MAAQEAAPAEEAALEVETALAVEAGLETKAALEAEAGLEAEAALEARVSLEAEVPQVLVKPSGQVDAEHDSAHAALMLFGQVYFRTVALSTALPGTTGNTDSRLLRDQAEADLWKQLVRLRDEQGLDRSDLCSLLGEHVAG